MSVINGNANANTLNGTGDDDEINGLGGGDKINGLAGNDTITGGTGNDTLDGGQDNDTYLVGPSDGIDLYNDTGTAGTDQILATADGVAIGIKPGFKAANGIEIISADGHANVTISGGANADTFDFSATTLIGIASIDGGAGNDTLTGSTGADTLNGGAGNDTMKGGEGGDTYRFGAGDGIDTITDTGTAGTDLILAAAANVAITLKTGFGAANGIEVISGNGYGGVHIQGSIRNDSYDFSSLTLSGIGSVNTGAGNDTVTGTANADALNGGTGNDTMNGGGGGDTVEGGTGNDKVNGGEGGDTYRVGQGDGLDTYADNGSSGVDTILATGDGVAITLKSGFNVTTGIEAISGGGHDTVTIQGGTGNDVYDFSSMTLTGIAAIEGGSGNDTITGSAGDDTLAGGAGNDTLKGGEGSDTYLLGVGDGIDAITDTGTSGYDQIYVTADGAAVGLKSGFGAANGIEAIDGQGHAHVTLTGGAGNDTFDFTAVALKDIEAITGQAGNDTITGSAGDDVIIGGTGNDALKGGDGADKFVFGLGDGADTIKSGGFDSSDVLQFQGMQFYDINYDRVGSNLKVAAAIDGDYDYNATGYVTLQNFFDGSAGYITVQLDTDLNSDYGTDADLTTAYFQRGLNGIDNADASEYILGGNANETIHANGGFYDAVYGGAGNDTVYGEDGFDNLRGQDGNDKLYGGNGDDILRGDAGNDLLDGGDGVDTARYTFGQINGGVWADLAAHQGKDLDGINDNVGKDTFVNIENLVGSKFGDELYGDNNGNFVGGALGDDLIEARDGDDLINGGGGNDTLDGGAGADWFQFGQDDGQDVIVAGGYDNADTIQLLGQNLYDANIWRDGDDLLVAVAVDGNYDFNDAGYVTLKDFYDGGSNVIAVQLNLDFNYYSSDPHDATIFVRSGTNGTDQGDAGERLIGSDASETFHAGGGFYDAVFGEGGNDTIYGEDGFDDLRGGDGNDQIYGGEGDDLLRGDDGNDLLDGGAGFDTARYSWEDLNGGVWADLAAHQGKDLDGLNDNVGTDTFVSIENLNGSTFGDELYGDSNDNWIGGGDGDDRIEGRGGDNSIVGGAGNDILNGGAGGDTFEFNAGDGFDTIEEGGYDSEDLIRLNGTFYDFNYTWNGADLTVGGTIDENYDFNDSGAITLQNFLNGSGGYMTLEIDAGYYNNLFYGTDEDLTTITLQQGYDGFDNTDSAELIIGGDGNDVINGNGGFYDGLFGGWGDDVITGGSGGQDWIRGDEGNDHLIALDGDDLLRGDEGDDILEGGAGNDTADFRFAAAGIVVDVSAGKASDDGDGGQDTLIGIESVRGSEHADKITGSDDANFLRGRGGDDTLEGGKGDDLLNGGAGADTFVFGADDGFDTIASGGYDSNDILKFNGSFYDWNFNLDGADLEVGVVKDDSYVLEGTVKLEGFLDGSAGHITVQFDGNDNNFFYGTDGDLSTIVVQQGLTGIDNATYGELIVGTDGNDVINGNGGYYDGIYGGNGDDTLIGGDDGSDWLRGSDGNDVLIGNGGDDALRGGRGDDVLEGGAGTDQIRYNGGDTESGIVVDLGAGVASDDGNGGHDTLNAIENVVGSVFDDDITGSNGDNFLRGDAGDDRLTGGLGDDQLQGGNGADTFVFAATTEQGEDTIVNFDKDNDKLAFGDVFDSGSDGIADDIDALVAGVSDEGAGNDVVVTFHSGSTLTFAGAGTGSVQSLSDLVADPASQIVSA